MIKLHLGCGDNIIPGYINVDLEYSPGIVPCDAQNLCYPSAYADLIYASHLLEHFSRHTYKRVLREWIRVLKPGGTLRLAVPDFDQAILHYETTHKLEDIMGLVVGGQKNDYDYHKVIFTYDKLKKDLESLGMRRVRYWDWRNTDHTSYDDYSQAYLPHMNKKTGRLMSLNLESTKSI